jgi:hypothetical protein
VDLTFPAADPRAGDAPPPGVVVPPPAVLRRLRGYLLASEALRREREHFVPTDPAAPAAGPWRRTAAEIDVLPPHLRADWTVPDAIERFRWDVVPEGGPYERARTAPGASGFVVLGSTTGAFVPPAADFTTETQNWGTWIQTNYGGSADAAPIRTHAAGQLEARGASKPQAEAAAKVVAAEILEGVRRTEERRKEDEDLGRLLGLLDLSLKPPPS